MQQGLNLTDHILSLLEHLGIQATPTGWIFQVVALLGILLFAWLTNWITKSILNSRIRKLVSKSKNKFSPFNFFSIQQNLLEKLILRLSSNLVL